MIQNKIRRDLLGKMLGKLQMSVIFCRILQVTVSAIIAQVSLQQPPTDAELDDGELRGVRAGR